MMSFMQKVKTQFTLTTLKPWLKALLSFCLILCVSHVFAEDILAGESANAVDTVKGTVNTYIYLGINHHLD